MATAATEVASFIDDLGRLKFPNVFNPYTDVCPTMDLPNAPEIRRENLHAVLTSALQIGARSLWVARDLGYRGGRRTGLAMTDDEHLNAHGALFQTDRLRRPTRGPIVAERTASVIWETLRHIGQPIFLWNVFPLHPHEPDDPMSNRLHTSAERLASAHFLVWLVEKLRPNSVVAIGRDAQKALLALGINRGVIEVRHPSYGGQTEFVTSALRHYGVEPSRQRELFD